MSERPGGGFDAADDFRLENRIEPLAVTVHGGDPEGRIPSGRAARLHAAHVQRVADEIPSAGLDGNPRQFLGIAGQQRRERVLSLYGQGALRSAPDNYFAALIMLYGDDVAHFE